ncbi:MAG: hypothetical protein LBP42_02435, partial [Treponema sp.]|nr:hypothetical protein [Treponema sp.]
NKPEPGKAGKEPPAKAGREKAAEPAYREVHIRLRQTAAEREEILYPLRDYLVGNPGSCSVFIHVPVPGGEAVIRTTSQLSTAANTPAINALTQCEGVAEVWRE